MLLLQTKTKQVISYGRKMMNGIAKHYFNPFLSHLIC